MNHMDRVCAYTVTKKKIRLQDDDKLSSQVPKKSIPGTVDPVPGTHRSWVDRMAVRVIQEA